MYDALGWPRDLTGAPTLKWVLTLNKERPVPRGPPAPFRWREACAPGVSRCPGILRLSYRRMAPAIACDLEIALYFHVTRRVQNMRPRQRPLLHARKIWGQRGEPY